MTSLAAHLLRDKTDLNRIRAFLKQLPYQHRLVDFEERMQIRRVRVDTRIWEQAGEVIALAYVDAFNNLWFEIRPDHVSTELEQSIMEWGLACISKCNIETGASYTLDFSCDASDSERMEFAERFKFKREDIRTLSYFRSLDGVLENFPIPQGFSIRPATGEGEVDSLVALHRAAFGTDNMTVEERLAIMRAPGYIPELDLVAVTPDGELCAFCICELDADDLSVGNTDPVGTHPLYQRMGLGRAILAEGLRALRSRGVQVARLGTSSENKAMQKLAEQMGFACVAERLWFSKIVPPKE